MGGATRTCTEMTYAPSGAATARTVHSATSGSASPNADNRNASSASAGRSAGGAPPYPVSNGAARGAAISSSASAAVSGTAA